MLHSKPAPPRRGGRKGFSIGIGGASILVVFVILALVALSALSLSSAGAELRLGQMAVQSMEEYYTADSKGEEQLARLDLLLKGAWDQTEAGGSLAQAYERALKEWADVQSLSVVSDTNGKNGSQFLISWEVPVNETKTLVIRVDAGQRLSHREGELRRLEWKIKTSPFPEEEQRMRLIRSGMTEERGDGK